MNIRNILTLGCGLLAGLTALTGCSDDESYDVVGSSANRIFLNPYEPATQENQIYNTPAGVFGLAGGAFNVKAQYATNATITVGAEVDNSLVEAFNAKNGTETKVYHALPEQALSALQVTPAVIRPGQSVGDTTLIVNVPTEAAASLTEEYYVVPFRLKVENVDKGDSPYTPQLRDTFTTAYAVIHNAGSDYVYTVGSFTQINAIVNTPVGVFGGVDAEFNVAVRANGDAAFTVQAEADNSLIASYNQEHNTSYQQLPADVASKLQITDGKIDAGKLQTSPGVKVTDPTGAAKNLQGSYLLPLKLNFVYPNGTKAELPAAYLIIETKNSFIKDDASELKGAKGNGEGWRAIDCSADFNPATFGSLFAGGWNSRWALEGDEDTGHFTVDLGAEKNLAGFYLDSYVLGNYNVDVSTDNQTWTSLGNTDGHQPVSKYDENWNQQSEYVLYGSVRCRYVRFSINFDTSGWAWGYGYYKAISGLSLYFE